MKACVNHTLLFTLMTKELFIMPETLPNASVGAMLYTTPVKAIKPAYLPEQSGPILYIDDKVLEAVYIPNTPNVEIIFDGFSITTWAIPSNGLLRRAYSFAVIKDILDGDISYKLAMLLPALQGGVEIQTHVLTKNVDSGPNPELTNSGYIRGEIRGYQVPGLIGAIVSVYSGGKDSFAVVAKNSKGELTLSSYETRFATNQVIGAFDYTTWGVLTDNVLIDVEGLKAPFEVISSPPIPEFEPDMSNAAHVKVENVILSADNIDLLSVNGINMLDANGALDFNKLAEQMLNVVDDYDPNIILLHTRNTRPSTVKIRLKANGDIIPQIATAGPYVKINNDGSVEYTIAANPDGEA